MQNPFTLTFGKEPASFISRDMQTGEIIEGFSGSNPEFQVCMITGVRGSGKTVLMTGIANELRSDPNWIVVDLNPERDMLQMLAAELSNRKELMQLFKDAKINLSFLGFGLEIDGVPPITDTVVALDRMLDKLTYKGKKVLVTIDEAVASPNMRTFASQFQIFMRRNYNVFLLMTGLYENINNLQNEKTLTFLYRAPKVALGPLNLTLIAAQYGKVFGLDDASALAMARETKGYSFAYQALGYLCFKRHVSYLQVIPEYDAYLEMYVYEKIWDGLSARDRDACRGMSMTESTRVADIRQSAGMDSNTFAVYRDRLLKRGVATSTEYGHLEFALPRFREFVLRRYDF